MKMAACLSIAILSAASAFAQAPPAREPSSPEVLSRVANRVRKELVRLPSYGVFDFLGFSLTPTGGGHKVVLQGFASRPTLKSAAEKVVRQLEGIDAVDNRIEELPLSRMDDDLRLRLYLKIYRNSSLSRYDPHRGVPVFGSPWGMRRTARLGVSSDPPPGVHPISLIVKNGDVTLEGIVDSESDKHMAGLLAGSVPGSFRVTNNLQVLMPAAKK